MAEQEETNWAELPIICPHCGNHGQEGGAWQANSWAPFQLIEEVMRSWPFEAAVDEEGTLILTADTSNDNVDWESGTNLRFECVQCFGEFALPDKVKVEYE